MKLHQILHIEQAEKTETSLYDLPEGFYGEATDLIDELEEDFKSKRDEGADGAEKTRKEWKRAEEIVENISTIRAKKIAKRATGRTPGVDETLLSEQEMEYYEEMQASMETHVANILGEDGGDHTEQPETNTETPETTESATDTDTEGKSEETTETEAQSETAAETTTETSESEDEAEEELKTIRMLEPQPDFVTTINGEEYVWSDISEGEVLHIEAKHADPFLEANEAVEVGADDGEIDARTSADADVATFMSD